MINVKVDLALIMGLIKKTHSAEHVYINGNTIITMNEFESVLSKIEYHENITDVAMFFSMSDMKPLLEAYNDILKENDTVMVDINNFPRPRLEVYSRMMDKYDRLLKNYYYHDTIKDIQTHPTILDMIASKAASGRFNLIVEDSSMNRFLMIIYKGLLPINKADTVTINIFKPIESNYFMHDNYLKSYTRQEDHFMTKFDIYKKKEKILIEQYMLFKIPDNYVKSPRYNILG
jgi:hypothetical protein